MSDQTGARVRERVWVDKIDHDAAEAPMLVERVALENGRVVEVLRRDDVPEAERVAAERRARGE